jgi:hypothetical protein
MGTNHYGRSLIIQSAPPRVRALGLDGIITPSLKVGLKVAVGGIASEVKKTSLSDIA